MLFKVHPDYTEEKNLKRHVSTRNQVNTMANELRLHFQKVLTPYLNKKVLKFSHRTTWTLRVKNDLEQIEQWIQDQKFRMYYEFSLSRIWVDLDKTYQVAEHAVDYVKQQFTICIIDGDTLASLDINYDKFRTDYTVEEIVETRQKIRELSLKLAILNQAFTNFDN